MGDSIPWDVQKIRPVPDPEWGPLVLGANLQQLSFFDGHSPRARFWGRIAAWFGLAVVLLVFALWFLLLGGPAFLRFALAGVSLGVAAMAWGDRALRGNSLRARHWGLYEKGIVCPGQYNSRDPRFQAWDATSKVMLNELPDIRFGRWKGSNWELLFKSRPNQVGLISKISMQKLFSMSNRDCQRLQREVITVARRFLRDEAFDFELGPE